MAATRHDVKAWFEEGKRNGYEHMIIVCDTFDWEDYPIYTKGLAEFTIAYRSHDGVNMQKVMEVYDLNMDMDKQLSEHRANHYPKGF